VLALLAMAAATAYLTRHCLAVANTTIQEELGITNEQFGYLYSAFSIGYLMFQIPGGWLGQRFGTRLTMPLLSLLWSAMTVVTASVMTLPGLISARLVFGLAQAGLIPNQAKVINDWFPAESRGSASSVVVLAMSAGGVASLWLTSWLMRYYDWRTVFHAYSLVGVGWAVLFFVLFRSRPSEVEWLRGLAASDAKEEFDRKKSGGEADRLPWRRMLGSGSVWGLAGQALFKAAGYNLLVTFLPAVLEFAYGVPKGSAGMLTSWSLIGVICGSMLGGWLIDNLQRRTGSRRISRCGLSIVTLLLTALLMSAAPLAVSGVYFASLMALAAFFSGITMPCPWAATIDIGGRNSAVVMGFMNSGACLAGVLISPLVGRLIDYTKATEGSWGMVIFVHAAFYAASAICWLAVNPERTLDAGVKGDAL
jgi:ACS family glucarate transporter-like MFS transporter/ACS family D-galactonate transporter-like MFS transporter